MMKVKKRLDEQHENAMNFKRDHSIEQMNARKKTLQSGAIANHQATDSNNVLSAEEREKLKALTMNFAQFDDQNVYDLYDDYNYDGHLTSIDARLYTTDTFLNA